MVVICISVGGLVIGLRSRSVLKETAWGAPNVFLLFPCVWFIYFLGIRAWFQNGILSVSVY